jgi:hypothetical protein
MDGAAVDAPTAWLQQHQLPANGPMSSLEMQTSNALAQEENTVWQKQCAATHQLQDMCRDAVII